MKNSRNVKRVTAMLLAGITMNSPAGILLPNGSFETIGTQYSPALGGIFAVASWTNLSGLNLQAASVPNGTEGTPTTTTGSRILRLVNDEGNVTPANVGRIAQNLGPMVTGETYTFNADAFGGTPIGINWGATAKLVNQGSNNPSVTYAAQTVSGVGSGVFITNAFNLSYTALAGDNGQPLWIWLEAIPAAAGQATRGGIDNARVTTTGISSAKDIFAFTFPTFGDATITGTNITMTLPYGTSVTNLSPALTTSPLATANPVSGTARNFSTPKTYIITAQDNSTKTYLVTVTVAPPSSAADFLTFDFGALGAATISGTNILKIVTSGTAVTNLAPTFIVSPFATASPVSGTARNFTTPQPYVVTAQNGSTKTHLVSVSVLLSNLVVQTNAQSLHVNNGLVSLDLVRTNGGLRKTFSGITSAFQWMPVCSSFVPDFVENPGGNALFDSSVTSRRYRVHEMATNSFSVISQSPTNIVIQVVGSFQGAQLTETMTLNTDRKFFHVRVTATLPTNTLDYCMSSYEFNYTGTPEFVHSPTTKKDESRWSPPTPASGQVLSDECFHSPAVVLQQGGLFAAIVPDLDSINQDKVLSSDARRVRYNGGGIFDTPVVATNYSMPTALDLNLVSGLSSKPVLSYGMMDSFAAHHMHYYRVNDASMIRSLASTNIAYAFDLFVGAEEPTYRGYQQVIRHLWQQFGSPLFRSRPHLAMPFEDYVNLVYGIVSQPMPANVQPPVPGYDDHGVFLDFTISNTPCCSMVAPLGVLGFGDALWNFEFWNPIRDASGMYYWGQKLGKPDLTTRARNIINLALLAPTNNNGLFSLVYLAQSQTWLRSSVSVPAKGLFSKNNDTYDVPAMSKTAAHMVEFYKQCEPDARIISYLTPYANWLSTNIDAQGRIPSYYTVAMTPNDPFAVNAQAAATMWFLSEFYSITNNPAYLAGAARIAGNLITNVLPNQLWVDLEPWFSDGQNPYSFTNDVVQGLPVKGNLSTVWAAEGFASLYRNTGSAQYLTAGEQVIDYYSFSQAGWDFHYRYTAFSFGGITSDNVDTAAQLDARQCEAVNSFFWYGETLGRQDLVERAVAAARSSAVLINHPLHLANNIYAWPNIYGLGLGPENIDHEGHPQSAMRTHPSWGECSGIFTGLGTADRLMNGCYVNATNGLAVGVNGLWCTNVSLSGNTLALTVTSQLATQPSQWTSLFRTTLQIVGLQSNVNYQILINNLPAIQSTNYPNGIIPIKVATNGAVSLAFPEIIVTPQSLTIPPSGTGTCAVVLSDLPSSNATVSITRSGGDTDIALSGSANLLFTATNWNQPKTVTFTAPRGTNWQNRSSVFLFQSPGYTNSSVTVTDVVVIAPRMDIFNGSFEIIDTLYSSAIGGIYHPTGWTNLSGLDFQAASLNKGGEGTSAAGATENRFLRLVSDVTDPNNIGRIAQEIGPMIAGETYTFRADILGGTGAGNDNLWGATAAFVNQVAANPSIFYKSQIVSNITAGQVVHNGSDFSYTAQPTDNGNPIVIWLEARAVTNNVSSIRGGIDNARFTITPLPVTISVVASPTNGGFVSGGGVFAVGTNTQITATASNYWLFNSWDDGNTNMSRSITAPSVNTTYTASFTRIPPQPVIASFKGPEAGSFTISGTTDSPGSVVTERTFTLSPPINWKPIQTNTVPGGAFSFVIQQSTNSMAFFRLRGM